MNLKNGSSFEGAINNNNTGKVSVILDSSSTLTLTSDTYIKSLSNTDTANNNINTNGYKLYVNGTPLK